MNSPGNKNQGPGLPGRAAAKAVARPFISAELLTITLGARTILNDLSFIIARGEHWALVGEAGVGKSTLGKALCGQVFVRGELSADYDKSRTTAVFVDQWYHFTDRNGLSSNFYYQQRYNSQDAESAVTVFQELEGLAGPVSTIATLLTAFDLEHRKNTSLVQLSSGEHKKLQLIRAFLTKPQLLVLDNPYVGLDVATCARLDELFVQLASEGTQLVIIGESASGLPNVVTHVATLRPDGLTVVPREAYQLVHDAASVASEAEAPLPAYNPAFAEGGSINAFGESGASSFESFIRMEHVRVQYESKIVLDDINWTVKKGERWWVKGHNGAGKSTLLSLVVGDNPQAYANQIYLFDKRRGSGESIWDIKRKIGYISPELHWYFDQQTTCADAIATGFFDTTGLYRAISAEQEALVEEWLNVFDLQSQRRKRLQDLSVGNQRLTLLARALVKNPPVLILDEPCQGLDDRQSARFVRLVDRIMEHPGRTLLYVNHRTDQLPACIDHLLALSEGKQITNEPYQPTFNRTTVNTSPL